LFDGALHVGVEVVAGVVLHAQADQRVGALGGVVGQAGQLAGLPAAGGHGHALRVVAEDLLDDLDDARVAEGETVLA
jgi:hypothetical protein